MATDKYAYLKMVDGDANNYKFYEMKINEGAGTFTAFWARIKQTPQSKVYSLNEWDKVLKSKLKKGYVDHTEEKAHVVTKVVTKTGAPVISLIPEVADIIAKLQQYANVATSAAYEVKTADVTQKMVDNAQNLIDQLSTYFANNWGKTGWNLTHYNALLQRLFGTIERRIATNEKLADYLAKPNWGAKEFSALLQAEQDLLDSMASQVVALDAADDINDSKVDAKQTTLLDQLGIKMNIVTDQKIISEVKRLAQEHSKRVLRVFEVINANTQRDFDTHLAKAPNKYTELFWHGSRRQNWWFIVQQGLRIRPSGAVYTGSMFGDGIYFASECDKSMGYTDSGRWVGSYGRNGSNKVYMALYNVHLGKQYKIQSSDSSLSASKLQRLGGYDSTWGQKGHSLMRHEYIVYNSAQCTIKYLIEFAD